MESDHDEATVMIEVTQEKRLGWCVLGVRGRADAVTADELENKLRAAIQRNLQVAADLSALEYISSCGLRAVLQAAREAQSRKVRFAVYGMTAPVRRVFEISGVYNLMEIHGELPA
jgi:anti-anti-sigma factor